MSAYEHLHGIRTTATSSEGVVPPTGAPSVGAWERATARPMLRRGLGYLEGEICCKTATLARPLPLSQTPWLGFGAVGAPLGEEQWEPQLALSRDEER